MKRLYFTYTIHYASLRGDPYRNSFDYDPARPLWMPLAEMLDLAAAGDVAGYHDDADRLVGVFGVRHSGSPVAAVALPRPIVLSGWPKCDAFTARLNRLLYLYERGGDLAAYECSRRGEYVRLPGRRGPLRGLGPCR